MLGEKYIAAVVAEGKIDDYLSNGDISHLFIGTEVELHAFVHGFVKQYGKMPSAETVLNHTEIELGEPSDPADYYLDLMRMRFVEIELKKAAKLISDKLMPAGKDIPAAFDVLVTAASEISQKSSTRQIIDLRDAYDPVIVDYVQQFNNGGGAKLRFGWPTLDTITGGIGKGDIVSVIGRPGAGKTQVLLAGAFHDWKRAATLSESEKRNTSISRLFVSMEMSTQAILQRLAAMQAHIPMTHLKTASLSKTNLVKLKDGLTEMKSYGAPFWVVDGNLTATVEEIHLLARQLKPDAIIIDGAYLLKHPRERDRFKRVAENADLIKSELAPLAPVLTSWQFAREAAKKQKSKNKEKVGLEDIGYSDAIGQVSSIVIGMSEDTSAATVKRRRLDIMKGRSGETGEFVINFIFRNMDFTEYVEPTLEDLNFI